MSEPFFITCSLDSFTYLHGRTVTNKPVNLSLCSCIRKSKFAWYPDNEGKPGIVFEGCGVEWVYQTEKLRDFDFNRIARNEFGKDNK